MNTFINLSLTLMAAALLLTVHTFFAGAISPKGSQSRSAQPTKATVVVSSSGQVPASASSSASAVNNPGELPIMLAFGARW
jgi:hypothetical protein